MSKELIYRVIFKLCFFLQILVHITILHFLGIVREGAGCYLLICDFGWIYEATHPFCARVLGEEVLGKDFSGFCDDCRLFIATAGVLSVWRLHWASMGGGELFSPTPISGGLRGCGVELLRVGEVFWASDLARVGGGSLPPNISEGLRGGG